MSLRGQHVLITGGSSGIGLALALQCAGEGARLSIVAWDKAKRRQKPEQSTIAAASPASPEVAALSADVAVEAEVLAAISGAERIHGPVDVLLACAGISRPGYFEEIPVAACLSEAWPWNYFGTLYAVKALIPAMRRRRGGAVVLVSSGAGLHGFFGYTPYSPSKFALRGLAEALRAEMRGTRASTSCPVVYPPDTDTGQLAEENLAKPLETAAITAKGGLWKGRGRRPRHAGGPVPQALHGDSRPPGHRTRLAGRPFSRPLLHWSFDKAARKAREDPRSSWGNLLSHPGGTPTAGGPPTLRSWPVGLQPEVSIHSSVFDHIFRRVYVAQARIDEGTERSVLAVQVIRGLAGRLDGPDAVHRRAAVLVARLEEDRPRGK